MKKCIDKFLMPLLVSILLTGCTSEKQENVSSVSGSSLFLQEHPDGTSSESYDVPSKQTQDQTSETLIINQDVQFPANSTKTEGKVFECEKIAFQEELLNGLLFKSEDIISQTDNELNDEIFGKYTNRSITLKNDAYLSFGGAYLYYTTPLQNYLVNCLRDDKTVSDYNMDVYAIDEDLPFISREDAAQKSMDFLEQLGIPISSYYDCYVLKAEILEEQERCIDSSGNELPDLKKGSWTEADECYHFKFHQETDDIKLTAVPYTGKSPVIEITYGMNGLVSVAVQNVYTIGKEKRVESLLTPQEILEILKEEQELLINTQPICIESMELVYLPIISGTNEIELRPVWRIISSQENEVIGSYERQLFYDASSGKEIL